MTATACLLLSSTAGAQIQPNDVLAAVIDTGQIHIITAGGNFMGAAPFATIAPDAAYGLCVRPNGAVLVVGVDLNNSTGTVYDITSGTPTVFASGFGLAISMECDGTQVLLGDALNGIFDITAGGDFTNATPFASGIETVGIYRDSMGTLWATHYNLMTPTTTTYGVFDITAGGSFANTQPFTTSAMGDAISITQFNGMLLVNELNAGRVINFTAGGDTSVLPIFATLPNVLGLTAANGQLYAGTLDGTVHNISAGGDFTNAVPFASGLGGGVYGLTFASQCGDGMIQPPEQCDDMGESATCDVDCTPPMCGDGVFNMTAGEGCDGGGESATCNADCTPAMCGDGVLNMTAGETCDDMGESATCDSDCSAPMCGDGVANMAAGEACDDMGESATCDPDCSAATCGDGYVNMAAGEVCDEMGESATCDGDCTFVECGDGVLNMTAGEECDDGNILSGDGCSNLCQNEGTGGMGGGATGSGGAGAASSSAATSGGGGSSDDDDEGDSDSGCSCNVPGPQRSGWAWLSLLGLGWILRRRRRAS